MRFQSFKTRLTESSLKVLRTSLSVLTRPVKCAHSLLGSLLEWAIIRAKTTAQRLLLLILMVLVVSWVSIFTYASFCHFYIPSAEISKPVYLGFNVCPEGTGICSFPSANVSFGRSTQSEEVLSSGQKYRIVLELEMPDCPENQELGMFMVVMRMYDRYHYVSAESRRSVSRQVVTKYRSFPLRLLDMLIWSPLYFFGFTEEKQFLSVELFSAHVDDYYHPSVGATIEIQSHKIQFYSARVKLFASFSGLKYIVHNWPITSAFFGIWWNIFLCLFYIAVIVYNKKATFELLSQSLRLENENREDQDESNELSEAMEEEEVTDPDQETFNQSTQTKENNEDDPETYDLPLVQEPADFVDGEADLELMTDLRHRRLQ